MEDLASSHSEQSLRQRAAELSSAYWFHTTQLFDDLVMPGAKTAEYLDSQNAIVFDPVDLTGQTVLDIGTWNGHFAFTAARRGAASVTAADSFVWRQPIFRGRETFDLALACNRLGDRVRPVEIDPTELPGDLTPFDVVLFLGVFYHLLDPIDVLKRVASLTKNVLVVETYQDLRDVPYPAMRFYPRDTLNGDPTNWWGPNAECMWELLSVLGFETIIFSRDPLDATRGFYHAARSAAAAARLLSRVDAVLVFDLGQEDGRRAVFATQLPDPGEAALATPAHQQALTAEIEELRRERALLTEQLAAISSERDAILRSSSWQATAPLRLAKRLISGRH